MPLPIDPSFAVNGAEWGVGNVGQVEAPAQPASSQGFGGMLSNAVSGLEQSQTQAAGAAQTLVDGTATDPSSVVMQVERAQLAMQLASQIRTKGVEAFQEIFHTQV
jgi:flagellar hook-basal body complex protein FliE